MLGTLWVLFYVAVTPVAAVVSLAVVVACILLWGLVISVAIEYATRWLS